MDDARAPANRPARPPGRGLAKTALLGLALTGLYASNGREIGSYDTEPSTLTAYTLARGRGIYLDGFRPVLREGDGRLPAFVKRSKGHIVSLYPLGTALMAAPLVWPQAIVLDRLRPGWDAQPGLTWGRAKLMAGHAAAILAALVGVALYRLLRALGLGRVALPAVVVVALGSDLWTVAGEALWQHGPAALALTVAVGLLTSESLSPLRLGLAGLSAGVLVACRLVDAPLAAVLLAWVAVRHPSGLAWFLPGPIAVGAALVAFNLHFFGTLTGGQAVLEGMHEHLHGVPGPWSGDLLAGALGTLLSPSRGLFVFCPWVPLALATAPMAWSRLPNRGPSRWMVGALAGYFLMYSKYAVWWAGHSFGPRYWTDVMPIFGILLALGLDWARERCRPMLLAFALTGGVAVGIQALGAFCYSGSWNLFPKNVDTHHERLWDWSDSVITRCVVECFGTGEN